jgi:hypothetical protein
MSTEGDLDDRIRAQRPRPGWTTGAEGVRTWNAVRSAQGRVRESATRRTWLLAAAAAVVLVCAATLAVRVLGPTADVAAPRPTNGRVVIIDQGLTYDADDLRAVMTHTDTVFVARVLEVTDRDEDAAWTTFTVAHLETIAGQPPAEPRIRQHGYVDRQGTLHIIENQSLVEVGGTYVFATNVEPSLDVYTVAPGPYAARPTEPEGQRTLVQQYRVAR